MFAKLGRFPLFAMIALLALPLPVRAAGGPDLGIGFVGSLSGPDARSAQDELDGFKLGIKHLGGRLAGVEFTFTVIDDKHDLENIRAAVGRLQKEERKQIILVASDLPASSLTAQLGASGKTFVLSLNPPAPALSGKECSAYFFSLAGLADSMNELSGQYLQAQGYHRVALAGPALPIEKVAAEAFRKGFKGEVVEILSRRGEMDFTDDLRLLRRAKPDAVYLLHTGGMAVNFISQYAEAKLKEDIPLFGPATTFDQTILAASGPAALDLFSIGPWAEDFDTPSSRRMTADFEGEYGRPASLFAAQGYDAAMLLDAAIRQVDKKFNDDDLLRAALRRVEFASTRGAVHFDTNHFPVQSYVLRQAVRDSRGHMANEQRGLFLRDARDGHAGECPMRWVLEPFPPPKG